MERRLTAATEGVVMTRGRLSGYRLAFDPEDSKVIWMGLHEPEVQKLIVDLLGPGQTAFDIGAHIGFFVMLMSDVVGRDGTVVGFEPDLRNLELLERNILINDLGPKVSAIALAFGDEPGEGVLERGLQSGFTTVRSGEGGTVKISTIDREVYSGNLPRPDFILIDTEGAEAAILRGARRLLGESPPILLLEHHDQGDGAAKDELRSLLPSTYTVSEPAPSHLLCLPRSGA